MVTQEQPTRAQGLAQAQQLFRHGRLADAESVCRSLLEKSPEQAAVLHLLGLLQWRANRKLEAEKSFRRAVQLAPRVAEFHDAFGRLLVELGRMDVASRAFEAAVRADDGSAGAWHRLGTTLMHLGRWTPAIAATRRAIQLRPNLAAALENLALGLEEVGEPGDANAWRWRLLSVAPTSLIHSGLLLAMLYTHGDDPETIFAEHLRWAARWARPFHQHIRPHPNDPNLQRQIRVGFVSDDFRNHPMPRFLEPLWGRMDPGRFHLTFYSATLVADQTTARVKCQADTWRDVAGMPDEALAELIRADRIDILVELTGHMPSNRLLLFARKPAPIQVTYAGYPATTGLTTMDYRITDALHDPPSQTDRYHTEQLIRLPNCAWCYLPDTDSPPVNELPMLSRKTVTFAALNRLVKVTPQMIQIWAEILNRVPASRLMILAPFQGAADPAVLAMFARHGIGEDRLICLGRTQRPDFLKAFHQVDLCLDTFPYNGHTTTCDAMWMGVPTVTLCGQTHVARAGLSVLTQVDLQAFVTNSPEQYISTAVQWAQAPQRLAEIRRQLRERMLASNLCDSRAFCRGFEEAFAAMWAKWCAGRQISGSDSCASPVDPVSPPPLRTTHRDPWRRVAVHRMKLDNLGDQPLNDFLLPRLFPQLGNFAKLRPRWIIFGFGSVLGRMQDRPAIVETTPWLVLGTGYQYGKAVRPPIGSQVFAVRGRYTCRQLGLDERQAVADGALLLVDHLPRDRESVAGREARIMKWDYRGPVDESTFTTVVPVDVPTWMQRLWACERIATDSLHAAILADAYGIPWRPLRWEPKWADHFGMLGINRRPEDFVLTDRARLAEQTEKLRQAVESMRSFVESQDE